MANMKSVSLLLLRLGIAAVFLYHGLMKFNGFPSGVMGMFEGMGFPGFLGPIVAVVEVVGALMLIFGIGTKWAAYALSLILLVAIFGVHLSEGFSANVKQNMLIVLGNLVLASFGPGKIAIQKKDD